ncbi:hypothetical protein [Actinophytocola sp.]|uniref:hypothetical protein n=1 Tax=Actinophytocola sp. TaxID=1872138 RepID=UPI002ED08FEE
MSGVVKDASFLTLTVMKDAFSHGRRRPPNEVVTPGGQDRLGGGLRRRVHPYGNPPRGPGRAESVDPYREPTGGVGPHHPDPTGADGHFAGRRRQAVHTHTIAVGQDQHGAAGVEHRHGCLAPRLVGEQPPRGRRPPQRTWHGVAKRRPRPTSPTAPKATASTGVMATHIATAPTVTRRHHGARVAPCTRCTESSKSRAVTSSSSAG